MADTLSFRKRWTGSSGKDRKSTRLNSSHGYISYAVFCLKKKKISRTYAGLDTPLLLTLSLARPSDIAAFIGTHVLVSDGSRTAVAYMQSVPCRSARRTPV